MFSNLKAPQTSDVVITVTNRWLTPGAETLMRFSGVAFGWAFKLPATLDPGRRGRGGWGACKGIAAGLSGRGGLGQTPSRWSTSPGNL